MTTALQVGLLVALLALAYRPLGDYMALAYSSPRHLRAERVLYRIAGVDPDSEQRGSVYARSVVIFSVVSVVLLYALLRLQAQLPLSLGQEGMPALQSFNTAVSFVTNTNWQSYSGEQSLGILAQMAGLAVQNFLSAAVGMAVAIAVIRGFARTRSDRLGNFWVDLTRGTLRILLPLSVVAALALMLGGVVQNFTGVVEFTGVQGDLQSLQLGPVASQEAIKELGTNGGGYFNANSAHPLENPNGATNLLQIFLLLLIPFALPRTFGRMVGDLRQGYAVTAVMAVLWGTSVAVTMWAELSGQGPAPELAGAAMEGKETRFGVAMSALYAASTTGTSTGAVNSMHDSFTAFGGGVTLTNMMLGEVGPGGVGSGLYGLLVLSVVAVFIAGLMIGRTPEYLGKRIGPAEMKLVALYVLTTPAILLLGLGTAMAIPSARESILNPGAHGLSEVAYAFASAANNNGSAFAGLSANTDFFNVALGICMFLGRLVPIVLVLALAQRVAAQGHVPASVGTLPTHKPQFIVLVLGVVLLVAGLTYLPIMALGPIAEGMS